MAIHDFLNGNGHLGEDSCRSLQVGAGVVADQLLDGLVVVTDFRQLEHFLGARDGYGVDDGAVVTIGVKVDVNLGENDVGHAADARVCLEEESRAYVVDELLRVLVIFGMLVVGPHQVGSVVVVGFAVAVGVGIVETDLDAAGFPDGIVVKCVRLLLFDGTFGGSDVAFLNRVEVRVVALAFFHGFLQLVERGLHGGQ